MGTALAEMTLPQISPLAGEPIDRADAERLAGVLKALADPARLRLLSLIQSAPDGEACVCDLTAPLGLSQPTVSHHLRILTEAGLLEREKRGVWAFYRLVPAAIGTIADLLTPAAQAGDQEGSSVGHLLHWPDDLRDQLALLGQAVVQAGLVVGSGGNLSARAPGSDECWVTAAGTWLDRLSQDSFVRVRISDGAVLDTTAAPSSEIGLHLATYRVRPDANAIVHLHPQTVLLLDAIGEPIRLVTTDHAFYLRQVVTTPFSPPGDARVGELAAAAAPAASTA